MSGAKKRKRPRYRSPDTLLKAYQRTSQGLARALRRGLYDLPDSDARRSTFSALLTTMGKFKNAALMAEAGNLADWQKVRTGRITCCPVYDSVALPSWIIANAARDIWRLTTDKELTVDEMKIIREVTRLAQAGAAAQPYEHLIVAADELRTDRVSQRQAPGPTPEEIDDADDPIRL